MKKLSILSLLSLIFLFGCDSAHYKPILQSKLDQQKGQALCFPLPLTSKSTLSFPFDNFDLTQQLPILDIFVDLNLLQTKSISIKKLDGTILSGKRYSISQEGKNYYKVEHNGFCFANIMVEDIYRSEDIEFRQLGSRIGTGKRLYYKYHFTDIADWARDTRLTPFYKITIFDEQPVYSATAIYDHKDNSLSFNINNKEMIQLKSTDN